MAKLYYFVTLFGFLLFESEASEIKILINGSAPVFITDEHSPSVTMSMGIFKYGRTKYFNHAKLLTLARGLGPTYLRLGGTKSDHSKFYPDGESDNLRAGLNQEKGPRRCIGRIPNEIEFNRYRTESHRLDRLFYHRKQMNQVTEEDFRVNYTGPQFDQLMQFVTCVKWSLIFDLNQLMRKNNKWDPTNSQQLLKYAKKKLYKIDWELGNEPNSYRHKEGITISAKDVAKGFLQLNEILKNDSWWRDSKVYGPDANTIFRKTSRKYLKQFLLKGGDFVDAVTFHQYYVNSRTATIANFTDPKILDVLYPQVKDVVRIVHRNNNKSAVWLGETSSSFGGGADGLSNRYVAGFMWLDKLGLCARYGVSIVFRQTFFEGYYALLDDNFDPMPDYWLTLLYKRLVGQKVLDVTFGEGQTREHRGRVRIYAHCTKTGRTYYSAGSITLYYLNLSSRNKSLSVSPPSSTTMKTADVYILTSAPQNLNSSDVYLNGRRIELSDEFRLPVLQPKTVDLTKKKAIHLPKMSFGFLVLPDLRVSACL